MGGQTSTTGQQSTQAQTAPWKPAQPYLQQTLSQLGQAIGGTATSPGESSALQQLIQNSQTMPNFGGAAGDLAGQLLGGNYYVNPNSTVGQSYDALKAQYAPYTSQDYLNPYNNPAFKDYLNTTTNDIANRTNSMFAGAGRDLSGINQESLARGITEGTAPIFANQYNQNVGAQQNAINSLFQGGLGATESQLHGAGAGLTAAGLMPGLQNQNAQNALQAYALQYGLPLSKLSGAESLLLPIAGLGSQSSGTSAYSGTKTDPWYTQASGIMGALGGPQNAGMVGGAQGASNFLGSLPMMFGF